MFFEGRVTLETVDGNLLQFETQQYAKVSNLVLIMEFPAFEDVLRNVVELPHLLCIFISNKSSPLMV